MLKENLFKKGEEQFADTVEQSFFTLLNFDKEINTILKVDNFEEIIEKNTHIFPASEIIDISKILSQNEDKNIFILNEAFNDNLKNVNTGILNNFYKLYISLNNTISKIKNKKEVNKINVSIINMLSPVMQRENALSDILYLNNKEIKNDIALLRNLGSVNIFFPADFREANYLLKLTEKNLIKNDKNSFSYFKLFNNYAPEIFKEDYFEKDGHLKEYGGLPEIIYIPKNHDSAFEIAIISSGPILYNALFAARELEEKNYKVTILNMSLIQSSSLYMNQKIKSFINNFAETHKNILTIEEHSKVGGMGSLIAEIVAESKHTNNIRVERLGLEDDLSPRNIIAKCEEIVEV